MKEVVSRAKMLNMVFRVGLPLPLRAGTVMEKEAMYLQSSWWWTEFTEDRHFWLSEVWVPGGRPA